MSTMSFWLSKNHNFVAQKKVNFCTWKAVNSIDSVQGKLLSILLSCSLCSLNELM